MNDSPQLSPLTKYIIWENYLICLAIYSITSPRAHNSIQLQISISPKTIYFNLRKLLLHKNSIKRSKGGVNALLIHCMFAQTALILTAQRDEPTAADASGGGQESGSPSLFFECSRNEPWPCIVLAIISTHNLLTGFAADGLNWRKDESENPLSYFVSRTDFFFFSIFFFYFPSTALCFSRLKPTNCISRYSPPTLGLVAYEQKPISAGGNEKKEKKKKKESGQFSGER